MELKAAPSPSFASSFAPENPGALYLVYSYPTIEPVTMVRDCRRYRTVPLEAFVKGHQRVVLRVTTKVFDGCEKNTRQNRYNF